MMDHSYRGPRGGQCTFNPGEGNPGEGPCGSPRSAGVHAGYMPQFQEADGSVSELGVDLPAQTYVQAMHGETIPVLEMFHENVRELVRGKEKTYQGAWRGQGYMGNLGRILSKSERLRAMQWGDVQLESSDESVLDNVQDLAALCAFFEYNYRVGNKWGGGPSATN